MRVVNKLTKPGEIRRVDLASDFVRIQLANGQERVYRISTEMQVTCAWCGESLGVKEGSGQTGVSHGICPECPSKVLAEHEARR